MTTLGRNMLPQLSILYIYRVVCNGAVQHSRKLLTATRDSNIPRTRCCVSITTMVTRKRRKITIHVHAFFGDGDETFTLQKQEHKMRVSGTNWLSRILKLRTGINMTVDEMTQQETS